MIDADEILDQIVAEQADSVPRDAVEDTIAGAKRIKSAFQQRARGEQQRFENATDSEFWVAFCFQTRAQKEQFLRALKLIDLGDKYIDGLDAAEVLGVDVTEPSPAWPELRGPSARLRELT